MRLRLGGRCCIRGPVAAEVLTVVAAVSEPVAAAAAASPV